MRMMRRRIDALDAWLRDTLEHVDEGDLSEWVSSLTAKGRAEVRAILEELVAAEEAGESVCEQDYKRRLMDATRRDDERRAAAVP